MIRKISGADPALAVPAEPVSRLGPSGFDRGELAALQAFDDAYCEAWGWPTAEIDPDSPVQRATLRALKAAAPLLSGPRDYQDAMSEPSQAAYIAEQLRLESEGDR